MLVSHLTPEGRRIFGLIRRAERLAEEDPRMEINEPVYSSLTGEISGRLRTYHGKDGIYLGRRFDQLA